MMPFPESFEEQVRDCLACLYSFSDLHDQPLAEQLAPHLHGLQRVQMVRQNLIETIQHLSVSRDTNFRSTQQRHYVILQMRYVEEQSVQEVAQQLSLGERQYYREHRKAIQALCYLLWQEGSLNREHTVSDTTFSETDVLLAYSHISGELIHLQEVAYGAVEAVRGLADKLSVEIVLDETVNVSCYINSHALRQALILIVTHFLGALKAGDKISLSIKKNTHPQIHLMLHTARAPEILEQFQAEQGIVLESLLRNLSARLSHKIHDSSILDLVLVLDSESKMVLIIDDNPDAVRLMERYLSASQYRIAAAGQAEDGLRLAFELQTDAIILDVMLPGRDGWEVLQQLKNNPSTNHIPIIVCSVLNETVSDLAFSLGAKAYLHKPPGRLELLKVLAELGC